MLLLSTAATLLVACAQAPSMTDDYPPLPKPIACPPIQALKFHVSPNGISITPRCVTVKIGEPFSAEIVVSPPGFVSHIEAGRVKAIPNDSADTWLKSENEAGSLLTVNFEGPSGALGDHKYTVKVEGLGQIDPVVRVVGGIAP